MYKLSKKQMKYLSELKYYFADLMSYDDLGVEALVALQLLGYKGNDLEQLTNEYINLLCEGVSNE